MGTGNWTIGEWLKSGVTIQECAKRLTYEYPDIPMYRAVLLVRYVKKHGGEVGNPYWVSTRAEKLWRKILMIR